VDAGVLIVYGLITVVMTWPLAANLRGPHYLMFGVFDDLETTWNFWWMHHALADLHTWPFHTTQLFHPFGADLAFHSLSPLITTMAIPVTGLTSPETAFNLALLCATIFSAFTMYLLANYLVGDRRAAFVGGCVFAFCTVRYFHATHLNLISMQFIPLYVMFLIKMLREERNQRRHAAFAGLCLGFIFEIDYYQTIYTILFTICYLVYYVQGRNADGKRRVRNAAILRTMATRLLILAAVFLIVAAPLLVADGQALLGGSYVVGVGADDSYADIAAFFVPVSSWLNFEWLRQANGAFVQVSGAESLVYIGWLVILLLVGGTVKLARRSADFRFWLVFLLICWLLALGTVPHFLSQPLPLPGPYALWSKIPILNNVRIASRFSLLVMFAAGVLVAYTLRATFAWLAGRFPRLAPRWSAALLLLLLVPPLLLEHTILPFYANGKSFSQVSYLKRIAVEPGDFSVLTLPIYANSGIYGQFGIMYEASQHEHPTLGGSLSRTPSKFSEYYLAEEFIALFTPDASEMGQTGKEMQQLIKNPKALDFYRHDASNLIHYLAVRYLIVHPSVLPLGSTDFINLVLPLDEVYRSSNSSTIIYRVREAEVAQLAQTDTVQPGRLEASVFRLEGWEQIGKSGPFAWTTAQESELLTTVQEPANYSVTIRAVPMLQAGKPQTLTFYLNDEQQAVGSITFDRDGWREETISIGREHWRLGMNKLRLRTSYITRPNNGDGRLLGVGVEWLKFTPTGKLAVPLCLPCAGLSEVG